MNVLVACEESQRVCTEFRKKGHNAFSCDLQECSGGHPEWHIQGDVLSILSPSRHVFGCPNYPEYEDCIEFKTMDGRSHTINRWDLIIAHPPCIYLTVTGNRWFNVERYGDSAKERLKQREDAIEFFMKFVGAECPRIAIENPIGCMSTAYRKPNQVIQPYQFGDPIRKATCLWLKGLPCLVPTNIVEPDIYYYVAKNGRVKSDSRQRSACKKEDRSKHRSKTPLGIAQAMAEQWG